jgi:nitroreductase
MRTSVSITNLTTPAPSAEQLDTILQNALRVPDHGKCEPWRFIQLTSQTQKELSKLAGTIFAKQNPQANQETRDKESKRFAFAPCCIILVFSPNQDMLWKIPLIEQQLSCGALGLNLLHELHNTGFSGCWLTGWVAYHPEIQQALQLAPHESIAGIFHIGTAKEPPTERKRPTLANKRTIL